jgi:hypothetical protein
MPNTRTASAKPVLRKAPDPVEPSELNLDPYTFDVDGDVYSIRSFGAFTAGDIRRIRNTDELDMMFTLIEKAADADTIAALDGMGMAELGQWFMDWQRAAGVDLPN